MLLILGLTICAGISYAIGTEIASNMNNVVGWIAGVLFFLVGALIMFLFSILKELLSHHYDRAEPKQTNSKRPNPTHDNRKIHIHRIKKRESRLKGMSKFL